jgi:hypothetical protein
MVLVLLVMVMAVVVTHWNAARIPHVHLLRGRGRRRGTVWLSMALSVALPVAAVLAMTVLAAMFMVVLVRVVRGGAFSGVFRPAAARAELAPVRMRVMVMVVVLVVVLVVGGRLSARGGFAAPGQ